MTKKIRRQFRRLNRHNYELTSQKTRRYNCIAWAADENHRWWEPTIGYYWPDAAPREYTPEAGILAFGTIGYQQCADGQLEAGFEKVALYVDHRGDLSHAAKQLSDGIWTSKIGKL